MQVGIAETGVYNVCLTSQEPPPDDPERCDDGRLGRLLGEAVQSILARSVARPELVVTGIVSVLEDRLREGGYEHWVGCQDAIETLCDVCATITEGWWLHDEARGRKEDE